MLITQRLKIKVKPLTENWIPKHKAIEALLPHAISLERSGDHQMIDVILHVARNSLHWFFSWGTTELRIANLLSEQTTPSLTRATIHLSPHLPRYRWDKKMVIGWAKMVSTVLYSEEVCSSVIDTLLQLGSSDTLRPDLPVHIWGWLKEQPSLPPLCYPRHWAAQELVRYLRQLGDLDILKSYFVVVWSEWDYLTDSHFSETQTWIVEDFGGIGMQHHRAELISRLNQVLGQLDRGLEYFKRLQRWIDDGAVKERQRRYGTLREALLEADKKAARVLVGMSHRSTSFNRSTNPRGHVQNRIQPSPVLYLSHAHNLVP